MVKRGAVDRWLVGHSYYYYYLPTYYLLLLQLLLLYHCYTITTIYPLTYVNCYHSPGPIFQQGSFENRRRRRGPRESNERIKPRFKSELIRRNLKTNKKFSEPMDKECRISDERIGGNRSRTTLAENIPYRCVRVRKTGCRIVLSAMIRIYIYIIHIYIYIYIYIG